MNDQIYYNFLDDERKRFIAKKLKQTFEFNGKPIEFKDCYICKKPTNREFLQVVKASWLCHEGNIDEDGKEIIDKEHEEFMDTLICNNCMGTKHS